ncbi:MAG: hypothetical protein AVDCRST_MAG49-3200, partial [uncultured Thermomicrobiales bacterium]
GATGGRDQGQLRPCRRGVRGAVHRRAGPQAPRPGPAPVLRRGGRRRRRRGRYWLRSRADQPLPDRPRAGCARDRRLAGNGRPGSPAQPSDPVPDRGHARPRRRPWGLGRDRRLLLDHPPARRRGAVRPRRVPPCPPAGRAAPARLPRGRGGSAPRRVVGDGGGRRLPFLRDGDAGGPAAGDRLRGHRSPRAGALPATRGGDPARLPDGPEVYPAGV